MRTVIGTKKYCAKWAKRPLSLITVLLAFSSILTSCSMFFNKEETQLSKMKSVADYESAINGVYGLFTEAMSDRESFFVNVKGDDLYNIQYANYYDFISDGIVEDYGNLVLLEYETTTIWQNLYKVIASTNNIIVQYSQKEKNEKIIEMVGEAYLIRAYCYFRLTRTYGKIPLIENTDVNYSILQSSFTEIYEFIEYDLLMAQQLLPKNNSLARIPMVTPHRGTARAILAELYLNWAGYPVKEESKYAEAANTAKLVIDSTEYYGIGLMDDFASIWKKENMYNKESILSIFFTRPPLKEGPTINDYLFYGWASDSIHFLKYDSFKYWTTQSKFYNRYPRNYRKDITFYSNVYYYKRNYEKVEKYINEVSPRCGVAFRKFFYDIDIDYYIYKTDTSLFYLGNQRLDLFRFAHTLLTYAEASARSGNLNEKAYECVNMIRRRANNLDIHTPSEFDLKPGLSAEAFADSVVWERAWELAGEPEGRWFDLVRLEKVEELTTLNNPEDGDFPKNNLVTKDDYYFPIPQSEIILNQNLGE
jgi:starch-binding outer membrane protein, SusD/RagB family